MLDGVRDGEEERTCESKYPCAPCNCAPSAPALYKTSAAYAHRSTRSSISSTVNGRGLANFMPPRGGAWMSDEETGCLVTSSET